MTGLPEQAAPQGSILAVGGPEIREALRRFPGSLALSHESRLPALPGDGAFDLLLVDYDHLLPAEREQLVQRFQGGSRSGKTRLLLISERDCRPDFPRLFGSHTLTNLVARNGQVDALNLLVTARKLLLPDIFGLDKYLSASARGCTMEVRGSEDKLGVLDQIERFGQLERMKGWMIRLLCSVADEFITNAVYNAPVDEAGNHRYAHLPRSQPVRLNPREHVRVRVALDGRRVAVSATDPFGSLKPERLMDYLAKCFRKGDDQVDDKAGGAGLGFYAAFESLNHFVVNLAPGRTTEVIGLLDMEKSYKQFATLNKSFNIFVAQVSS